MNNYNPPYTITSKMLTLSTAIGEALTKLEYEEKKIITPKLRKKNRIKTIAGTLEIEGNFAGEEKVTALIDGKKVLGSYEEIKEVEGVINAYKEFESYRYDNLDDLLKAHKLMMSGILKTAGSFRNINVGVGNCEGVFHYEFEFIHPFSDGNGRIGRLWQSVILYHWKKVFSIIPTESIIRDNQEAYYKALEEAGALGESTPFVEFMLEIILETIQKVGERVGENFTSNQIKILDAIRLNSKISAVKLSQIVGISSRKIEENIKKLKQMGVLRRVGSAKGGYWEIIGIIEE